MEILKKYIAAAFSCVLSLLFTGCFEEFDPGIEQPSVLFVNALIHPGETLKVDVTHTWAWTESDKITDVNVRDAQVRLYVNGEYAENLKYEETDSIDRYGEPIIIAGYYGAYIPREGDNIRIEAECEAYGRADAEVTVPHAVDINRVEMTLSNYFEWTDWNDELEYNFDLNSLVYFTDPAAETNYYMFEVAFDDPVRVDDDGLVGVIYTPFIDYSREPLFSEHMTVLDWVLDGATYNYSFFTDRQISGKEYALHIPIERVMVTTTTRDVDMELEHYGVNLTLYSISRSYYDYLMSVWMDDEGANASLGVLGNPVFPVSNVSSGAGVVASTARSTMHVELASLKKD